VSASSAASFRGLTPSAAITARMSGSDRASLNDMSPLHPEIMTALLFLPASGERGIVDVSPLLARIERRLVGPVERRLAPPALRKIRVRQERHTEGDEIGFIPADRRLGRGEIEAAVDHVGAVELVAQHARDALLSIGDRVDDMQVGDSAPAELLGEMGEGP